jgi:glutamate-1-semialdehyde 2,1-aminomutase
MENSTRKNQSTVSKSFARVAAGLHMAKEWTETDSLMRAKAVDGFVPDEVFDIHSHLIRASDFSPGEVSVYVEDGSALGLADYESAMARLLPGRRLQCLQFGYPLVAPDFSKVNSWLRSEVLSRPGTMQLAVVPPHGDPEAVASLLAEPHCKGIKPYHLLTGRADSYDCLVEDYAPEWMWELLHGCRGILMLHIVRDRAIADPENIKSLRRLASKYPGCQVVLAHAARSFCYRHGREGMKAVADLDNVHVDTSVVAESEALRSALETFGPDKVLFGSDFPCSHLRGRCVAIGDSFYWLHDRQDVENLKKAGELMTLVGLESLLCLREACEDFGATESDLKAIFSGNARRILGLEEKGLDATETWKHARDIITGGTGLLSKRREQFDAIEWPSYFSKCSGTKVWDLNGKSYLDMAGGVGAILLGYADPDVDRAVRRRMGTGSYCTLVSPDEIELAELLLELNPWAGQVRYARGGGDAVAMAVRIARAATGKSGILFCGYHGWHDWYLAANLSSDGALDGHLLPGLQPLGVPRELLGTSHPFRYNNWESFESALATLGDNFAGVVMEPMRSEHPRDNFLLKVRDATRAKGGVFMIDEVTSGWRFGFPGAHTVLGVDPDVAIYAKAMSNGYPAGAIVGRREIMGISNASFISSSFYTDGVGTVASLATIKKFRACKVYEHVNSIGGVLKSGLEALAAEYPGLKLVIGGMPPSPNLRFDLGDLSNRAKVFHIRAMLAKGFLASTQLFLFHSHTAEHVQSYLSAMDDVLADLNHNLENGSLKDFETGSQANMFARLA